MSSQPNSTPQTPATVPEGGLSDAVVKVEATPTQLIALLEGVNKQAENSMKTMKYYIAELLQHLKKKGAPPPTTPPPAASDYSTAAPPPPEKTPLSEIDEIVLVGHILHIACWAAKPNTKKFNDQVMELALWVLNTGFLPVNLPFERPPVKFDLSELNKGLMGRWFGSTKDELANYDAPQMPGVVAAVASAVGDMAANAAQAARVDPTAAAAAAVTTAAAVSAANPATAMAAATAAADAVNTVAAASSESLPTLHEQLVQQIIKYLFPLFATRSENTTILMSQLLFAGATHEAATTVGADNKFIRFDGMLSVTTPTLVQVVKHLLRQFDSAVIGGMSKAVSDIHSRLSAIFSRVSQHAEKFQDSDYLAALIPVVVHSERTEENENNTTAVAAEHQRIPESDVMSLSLVLQLIVNGGPVFRTDDAVTHAVQHLLFPYLVTCSLDPNHDTHRLAFSTFVTLFRTFKGKFPAEFDAYFGNVLFKLLESKTIETRELCLVIDVLLSIVEEPSNLIDIFLNFDCHSQRGSVYEGILQRVSGLAGGSIEPLRVEDQDMYTPAAQNSNSDDIHYPTSPRQTSAQEAFSCVPKQVDEQVRHKAQVFVSLLINANQQWIERFEGDMEAEKQAILENAVEDATPGMRHSRTTSVGADDVANQHKMKKDLQHAVFLFNEKADAMASFQYLIDSGVLTNIIENADVITITPRTAVEGDDTPAATATQQSPTENDDDGAAEEEVEFNPSSEDEESPESPDTPVDISEESTLPPLAEVPAPAPPLAEVPSPAPPLAEVPALAPLPGDVETPRDQQQPATAAKKKPSPLTGYCDAIANFLILYERKLNKVVLGEFFGKAIKSPETLAVFTEWTHLQDFKGLELDEALRKFLGGFKMVGEAQLVDKSMELFSEEYCTQNKIVKVSGDESSSKEESDAASQASSSAEFTWNPSAAFVLAFSICMLNTDAHSVHVKQKMTLEEFIKNNRGINNGEDIDEAILTGIYNRIVADEIILRSGDANVNVMIGGVAAGDGVDGGVLSNIPVLRSIVPVAAAVVMYPFDKAGDLMFDHETKRKDEAQRAEFQTIFETALDSLKLTKSSSQFLSATSLEHAIPMWDLTADSIVSSLFALIESVIAQDPHAESSAATAQHRVNSSATAAPVIDPSAAATERAGSVAEEIVQSPAEEALHAAVDNLVDCCHVCLKFGDFGHVLYIIESLHALIRTTKCPMAVLRCSIGLVKIFVLHGNDIPKRGWRTLHSFLGWVSRPVADQAPSQPEPATRKRSGSKKGAAPTPSGGRPDACLLTNLEFTDLQNLVCDPQRFAPDTQVTSVVAAAEVIVLRYGPQPINRLCDMLRVALEIAPRMQWREMWAQSSQRLTHLVGVTLQFDDKTCFDAIMSLFKTMVVADLRRENVLVGFQLEMVKPLENIFIAHEGARREVLRIVNQIVDLRASNLESAWSCILLILGHCASINKTLNNEAWSIVNQIMTSCMIHLAKCFPDFLTCLASFATGIDNDVVVQALQSGLGSCGDLLRYGLANVILSSNANSMDKMYNLGVLQASFSAEPEGDIARSKLHNCWRTLQSSFIPIIVSHPVIGIRLAAIRELLSLLTRHGTILEEQGLFDEAMDDLSLAVKQIANSSFAPPLLGLTTKFLLHSAHIPQSEQSVQKLETLLEEVISASFKTVTTSDLAAFKVITQLCDLFASENVVMGGLFAAAVEGCDEQAVCPTDAQQGLASRLTSNTVGLLLPAFTAFTASATLASIVAAGAGERMECMLSRLFAAIATGHSLAGEKEAAGSWISALQALATAMPVDGAGFAAATIGAFVAALTNKDVDSAEQIVSNLVDKAVGLHAIAVQSAACGGNQAPSSSAAAGKRSCLRLEDVFNPSRKAVGDYINVIMTINLALQHLKCQPEGSVDEATSAKELVSHKSFKMSMCKLLTAMPSSLDEGYIVDTMLAKLKKSTLTTPSPATPAVAAPATVVPPAAALEQNDVAPVQEDSVEEKEEDEEHDPIQGEEQEPIVGVPFATPLAALCSWAITEGF